MEKKTKYIFLSNGYRGGATTFIHQHIEFLLKKRKKVILIDDNPLATFGKLNNQLEVNKINVSVSNKESQKKIYKIFNSGKEKKILFITNYAFIIKYFFLLRNFKRNKNIIILTLHSGIFNLTLKGFLLGMLFSILYKYIDFIFFGSNTAKNWWLSKYPWMKIKKCPIFYNGTKVNYNLKPRKLKKKLNISFVGRLVKEHDPLFFIDIANEYFLKNTNTVFNFFGDGPLLKYLKKNSFSKKILFHGWCDKKTIYKKSDLLIVTSPVNNFAYVALEAKSHGIPVISCSKGDIKKIIKNNYDGIIKYTKSPKKMVNLINIILRNYKSFSKNSIKRSKKFEVNFACEKLWRNLK
tara:strand:- start:2351 stop:3403 length:1053 start_codon:yes stop_codon:yes gene_type:complete